MEKLVFERQLALNFLKNMQFKAIKTLSSFISGGENKMTSFSFYANLTAEVSKISEKHDILQQN